MFSRSSYPIGLSQILYDQTGSEKSNARWGDETVNQTRLDLTSFRGPDKMVETSFCGPDEMVDQTRLDLTSFRGPGEMVDQTRLDSTPFRMQKVRMEEKQKS